MHSRTAMGGLVPTIGSAQTFQGVIHFTMHDENGKTTQVVQMSKPGKMRFGTVENGQESGIIVDSTAGTVTFVDGREKTYTVISQQMMEQMRGMMGGMMRNMGRQRGQAGSAGEDHPNGKVTRTGRTDVVAGIPCEVWTYEGTGDHGEHETGEACLAKGVGFLGMQNMGLGMLGGPQARAAMQERYSQWGEVGKLLAQGYGILKASSFSNGKPNGSIEVTSVQRGAPADDQFQPPAGYKQQSMMGGRSH
jgi:hypothetical protein